ncbi:MAG TPA: TfoX/Sxy family DNA transformation protein [Candidatus Methanoperedens sp.]|nr:TfoX/Sxy family DNA transformation protein [Candidatus Methanoperedens sp.]
MEKVISHIIKDVGIGNLQDLKAMGSLKAVRLICKKQSKACVSMLYALESVIRGIDMDKLPETDKKELKRQYERMLREMAAPNKVLQRTAKSRR